ncbi:hypothetical protein [Mesorhizobium amorphae]|uniref:hypothetical protein n=1 Tax=Mesorhizobium amorphae TaxID=71433 RepID=UPI001642DEE2|nr:hypothetical protein [Mesorhizobium amorphae]
MAEKRLEQMAEEATADWLCRSSITYLECAISLMLTHMSKEAVIEVMRAETKMLEEMD